MTWIENFKLLSYFICKQLQGRTNTFTCISLPLNYNVSCNATCIKLLLHLTFVETCGKFLAELGRLGGCESCHTSVSVRHFSHQFFLRCWGGWVDVNLCHTSVCETLLTSIQNINTGSKNGRNRMDLGSSRNRKQFSF